MPAEPTRGGSGRPIRWPTHYTSSSRWRGRGDVRRDLTRQDGGRKGGHVRAEALNPERRREAAQKAAAVRPVG